MAHRAASGVLARCNRRCDVTGLRRDVVRHRDRACGATGAALRVAAGVPIAAQEEREGEFLVAADFLPKGSDAFVLRVKGDSMIDAAILDGDLVVVRPQNDARNGEIVVAMLEGDATVKRFYREAGRVRLQPENPRMQPIYADDVVIVGRVEAVIRRL